MKVLFLESTMYGNNLYRRGETKVIDEPTARALGSSVQIIEEPKKEAKKTEETKEVKAPPVDKMIRSAEVEK